MSNPNFTERERIEAVSDQARNLTRWLVEHAPYCEMSQKHLDPGTIEQAYWHYGYVCALQDLLALLKAESVE